MKKIGTTIFFQKVWKIYKYILFLSLKNNNIFSGCFALSGNSGAFLIQATKGTFAVALIMIWSIALFCANLWALQSVQYDFERLSEPAQRTYFNEVSNTHWIVTIVVSIKLMT